MRVAGLVIACSAYNAGADLARADLRTDREGRENQLRRGVPQVGREPETGRIEPEALRRLGRARPRIAISEIVHERRREAVNVVDSSVQKFVTLDCNQRRDRAEEIRRSISALFVAEASEDALLVRDRMIESSFSPKLKK